MDWDKIINSVELEGAIMGMEGCYPTYEALPIEEIRKIEDMEETLEQMTDDFLCLQEGTPEWQEALKKKEAFSDFYYRHLDTINKAYPNFYGIF